MKNGKFKILAYTGAPVDVSFGMLIFDLKGLWAKPSIPILREHGRDRVVGFSESTWHDAEGFHVEGRFTGTAEAAEVKGLALEGYPWQASVAVYPEKVTALDKGETAVVNGHTVSGPAEVWEEARVAEVSFCSLGADSNTGVVVFNSAEGGFMAYAQTLVDTEGLTLGAAVLEARKRRPDLHNALLNE